MGIVGGSKLSHTLVRFLRELRLVLWAALPAAASAYVAFFVLQLTAGTPATPLPSGDMFRPLAGEPFQPTALEREPVVINLWASWCPPCWREMPMMADVAANTNYARLVFVNQGEGAEVIRRFLETENLELDQCSTLWANSGATMRCLACPRMLQSVHMGEISREGLLEGIQKLRTNERAGSN